MIDLVVGQRILGQRRPRHRGRRDERRPRSPGSRRPRVRPRPRLSPGSRTGSGPRRSPIRVMGLLCRGAIKLDSQTVGRADNSSRRPSRQGVHVTGGLQQAMSNPSGPDEGQEPAVESRTSRPTIRRHRRTASKRRRRTRSRRTATHPPKPPRGHRRPTADREEHPTEVMAVEETGTIEPEPPQEEAPERRYTAPSGMRLVDDEDHRPTPPDPATEVFSTPTEPISSDKPVAPQTIPGRGEAAKPPGRRRSWGWVMALIAGDRRARRRRDPGHPAADPRLRAEGVAGGHGPLDDPELRRRRAEG